MKKILVDVLLFILMILEFSRMYLSPLIHEIIGILLIILVILHLILNKSYFKNIFKGKYNLKRVVMLGVNILFLITFILSITFGILSSTELLPQLNISNLRIIYLHKIFAYISLLCMSIHLGINFNFMFRFIDNISNKIVVNIIKLVIIIIGIYSFIKVDFINHMIGKYGFSIVTGNIFINIIEYLSIVMSITIITNIIYKKIK